MFNILNFWFLAPRSFPLGVRSFLVKRDLFISLRSIDLVSCVFIEILHIKGDIDEKLISYLFCMHMATKPNFLIFGRTPVCFYENDVEYII